MKLLSYFHSLINNLIFIVITLNECSLQLVQSHKKLSKVIVCGSSHAGCFMSQIDPSIHTLIFPSQDLECAYSILRFFKNHYNIDRFVIFVSVFSPGFSLKKSRVFGRGTALKIALIFARYLCILKILIFITNPLVTIIRFLKKFTITTSAELSKVSSQHLYYNKKNDQIPFLLNIENYCEQQLIQLFVVKSPASIEYIKICEESLDPFAFIRELNLEKTSTYIIDLWEECTPRKEDFIDYDHIKINSASSEKMTRHIIEVLKVFDQSALHDRQR